MERFDADGEKCVQGGDVGTLISSTGPMMMLVGRWRRNIGRLIPSGYL